jgi:hypothetical protein
VGERVVVDSAGIGGLCWTGDDAIDVAANADRSNIFFLDGTYPNFTADQANQTIEGESWDVIINGATIADAINITAARNTIKNLSVTTNTGGVCGGGSCDAIAIVAAGATYTTIDHVRIINADEHAILLSVSSNTTITNSLIVTVDIDGIYNGAVGTIIAGNTIGACGGDGISGDGSGDNFSITDNHVVDTVIIAAGEDNGIFDGNITDGAVTNNGTGNTIGDNEQY